MTTTRIVVYSGSEKKMTFEDWFMLLFYAGMFILVFNDKNVKWW